MTTVNFYKDDKQVVALETGCIVDGVHGVYAQSAMVRFAQRLGFILRPQDEAALERYEAGAYDSVDDAEVVGYLSEDAEDYLNARLENGWFFWHEGDFMVERHEEA